MSRDIPIKRGTLSLPAALLLAPLVVLHATD
jgi:hypothetical protein